MRADAVQKDETLRTVHGFYFIFLGSWYTMRCAYGVPSNMMYVPEGLGAIGSFVPAASKGHMSIQ